LSCILHSFPHILLMERKEFPPEENYWKHEQFLTQRTRLNIWQWRNICLLFTAISYSKTKTNFSTRWNHVASTD
jgi:hypothetical protein